MRGTDTTCGRALRQPHADCYSYTDGYSDRYSPTHAHAEISADAEAASPRQSPGPESGRGYAALSPCCRFGCVSTESEIILDKITVVD